jgi:hypothetical protein
MSFCAPIIGTQGRLIYKEWRLMKLVIPEAGRLESWEARRPEPRGWKLEGYIFFFFFFAGSQY